MKNFSIFLVGAILFNVFLVVWNGLKLISRGRTGTALRFLSLTPVH